MKSPMQIVPNWVMVLAAIACFAGIADLPYGYYRFLRWAICLVAIVSALQMHRMHRQGWVWILGLLGILFNPILPMIFEKSTWRIVDGAAGVIFLCVLARISRYGNKENAPPR